MAIIKSFSPFQNLSNFQTFLVDDNPISDYFRITEFKDTFTGGKNGFLIEGSEFLRETTEIKIELLDVEGNPIYFEPGNGIPEYYEGVSKLVSCHVYDDTPIGLGKITILGELKNYIGSNGETLSIPPEWKGVYNVKWERTFKVNKNLNNEDIVRFYKRPLINIDELVKPIFTQNVNTVTDSESTVSGIPQLPNQGTNLSTWRAGTFYKLIKSSGTWDRDVDENTISIPSLNYSPTIIEVLNDRELLVDIPYTDSNNIVQPFSSEPYSVTYQDFAGEVLEESALTGSFAKIDITQLKTFVGDVARVKVFRKSRSSATDFQFVQESKLESTELLRDIYSSTSNEIPYGRFDETNLSTYWITSSVDHPTTIDSSVLSQAVKVDYNGSDVQKLITSQSFSLSKNVEYTLGFKTLLSGSISGDKYLKAYFSGSYPSGNSFTQSFIDITPDGSYNVRKSISENILSEIDTDAKLVFEFKGDDWYVSNVSLKNAQDTSFSPDEFTLIQDIPRKLANETFDFRFEFYDINNNYIPVTVTATKEFNGGNDFPTSAKLLTFESDRNAFRYSSGSANPESQQIQFKVTRQNLTGSVVYDWKAYNEDGNYLTPTEWIQYPGQLTEPNDGGALLSVSNFEGIYDTASYGISPEVYSIIYTASLEGLEEFETVYRLEDGDNSPTLLVTSNANQFIYEPTTLSPKPSGQSITIRAQRKNLASLSTPITINKSIPTAPDLTYVDTVNGVDTYTISALQFSSSFAANNFDEVTYQFTGSDVFNEEQSDEITLSKVVNFDGVSVILSNESTTLSANSIGFISSSDFALTSGSATVYVAGNLIPFDDNGAKNTFEITNLQGTNCTPNGGNGFDPTDNSYGITDISANQAQLNVTVTYTAGDGVTSQSFAKGVSYTRVKGSPPSLKVEIDNPNQTVAATSTNVQTGSFENVTFRVIEDYNGVETIFEGPNDGRISNAFSTIGGINPTVSPMIGGWVSGSAGGDYEIPSIVNSAVGNFYFDYEDSEGSIRRLGGSFSLSKIKRSPPSLRIEVTNDKQTVEARSTGVQTGSFLDSVATVYEEYNGIQKVLPLNDLGVGSPNFPSPVSVDINTGEIFFSNTTNWLYETAILTVNGFVTDSEGVDHEIRGSVSLSKTRRPPPVFRIEITNDKQTVEALSNGTQTGSFLDSEVTVYEDYNGVETEIPIVLLSPGSSAFPSPIAVSPEQDTILFSNTTNWIYESAQINVNAYVTGSEGVGHVVRGSVSLNKARRPKPNTLITLSPQTQTVTSSSLAIGTPQPIQVSAVEGDVVYSYGAGSYSDNTYLLFDIVGGVNNLDGTFTPSEPGPNGLTGSVNVGYQNSEGTISNQTLSFDVSVAAAGVSGSNGESGSTGPGIVFRGPWTGSLSYQFDVTGSRRDSVLYNDIYYATLQPASGVAQAPTGTETDNAYWQSLGTQDFFVAAKIAIFEDSYIQNTLNIGTSNGGTGDSANITLYGTDAYPYFSLGQSAETGTQEYGANGIFIGRHDVNKNTNAANGAYVMSLSNTTNWLKWDGNTLDIKGDLTLGTTGDEINSDGTFTLANGDLTYNGTTFNFSADLDLNSAGASDGGFSTQGIYLSTDGWVSSENFYIGSDGTAKFSGELSAATGTFSGTVSAGGVTIGPDVISTYDGLYIDANNYWVNGGTVPFQVGNGTNSFKIATNGAIGVNVASGGMQFYNTTGLTQGMSFSHNAIDLPPLNVGQGAPSYITFGTGTIQGDENGGKIIINPTTVVDIQGDLDVSGAITADGNITAYASSDRRLKDNITPLRTPLIKISKIGGYEFDWNENQSDFEGHDVGVIAQEIQEVIPEVVTERKDGYLAVRYEKLVPLLIEGIKELTDRVEKLEEENKKLKEK